LRRAGNIYNHLRRIKPTTRQELRNYVKIFLGINIPDESVCPEHNSPMDYLWHTYSADTRDNLANADAIVWANRGGGKTQLAAAATVLDCLFKPPCQVRILAGSGEQAGRMYSYFTAFMRNGFEEFLASMLKEKCTFNNGSSVEALTQSAASIRGQHVHKLRCDEVELFDESVLTAAKFTTHSDRGLKSAMEIISTMHKPFGLMHKMISSAQQFGTPIFKWCLWEVIEKCVDRNCSQCPLWSDCGGIAKNSGGYLKIDDCITQMRRCSRAAWESEMLCKRPHLENVVFDQFDPAVHVRLIDYNPGLPLYRSLDFGFVNPLVCLWIQVDDEGGVRVINEYVRSRATIDVHAREITSRTPGGQANVKATFCDPAGAGVNDVTGTSAVRELKALGIPVRYRPSKLLEGIEHIRRAIRAGDGKSSLIISPKCPRLIEAMSCYHYPEGAACGELPFKDGVHDHPIDALRYFFVNYLRPAKNISRSY
jgi:hypothetical protein